MSLRDGMNIMYLHCTKKEVNHSLTTIGQTSVCENIIESVIRDSIVAYMLVNGLLQINNMVLSQTNHV